MVKIKEQKGLTIFELTVTFVLALIIMSAAGTIYIHFMNAWSVDKSRLEIQNQGTYALGVMEKAIKSGTEYVLDNYEDEKFHKITVTTLYEDKDTGVIFTKDMEYYLDDTTSPVTIEEKDTQTSVVTPLCRGTYIEGGEVKSYFEVEDLTFTQEDRLDAGGNTVARAVRIDLKLKKPDVEELFDFSVSVRLRNENVH